MASMPHQTPGYAPQQDSSPTQSSDPPGQISRRASLSQSTASGDPQTVLLNHPASSGPSPKPSLEPSSSPEAQLQDQPARPKPQTSVSSVELKKCWICLQDETDDTPTSSRWRSPCACRLQAHESCLLDWVAEVEKPARASAGSSKVECPQCKTPIRIVRPRSYFLNILRSIQRLQGRLILPFCGAILVSGVWVGCYFHGLASLYVVFGERDTLRIFGLGPQPAYRNALHYILPSIPVTLLASRTSYVDKLLPVLPLWYLFLDTPTFNAPFWPPSASMTLLALPYIRAVYNEAYRYLFAEKEKAWLKAVQPRGGEDGAGNPEQDQNDGANNGNAMNIELGIQVVIEEDGAEEQPPVEGGEPAPAQAAPPQGQGEGGGQNEEPIAAQLAQPAQQPNQHQNRNGNGAANAANAIPILINVLLEKAVGALIFPCIAAGMGFALKLVLPLSWTTPTTLVPRSSLHKILNSGLPGVSFLGSPGTRTAYNSGFLQSRFGRSIAGGYLFILLKDSLGLYSKYKMAQVHRQRSIADYDGRQRKAAR